MRYPHGISEHVRSMMVMALLLVAVPALVMPVSSNAEEKSPSAYTSREYRIGPEDVLDVSVWKEDGLQKQVVVRPDGGISFPLAGDLDAAGKTAEELQVAISKRIRKYIPDAVVTVSLAKISGYRIYVLGKVNNPGQFVVGRYVDVMQALTLAGGLTPYASGDDIKIIRRDHGKESVFPFRYSRVSDGDELKRNILLQSGDVVVVP
jgi:polysaccharide export outer membrane protein